MSDRELMTLGESIVDGTGDTFAILHTICARFGIAPKSISIDSPHQSNPSLFIYLFSALFTFLPNTANFHLLPLFTTILQRHPPSLPHLLSSPLWLSLPTILASPPQSPSTLQTQPQQSPVNKPQIEEQSHLRPVLAFVNSILQLCLSSSPPTPIPNKALLSSSLSALSSHPDPLVSVNSSSALLCLNKLDGGTDETSMSVDELVAQRDALRAQIGEKDRKIKQLTERQKQNDKATSAKDQTINTLTTELHEARTEKDAVLAQQVQQNRTKDETIAELTKKLGEFEAMEKRLNDELGKTHWKVDAVDARLRETANDVKWIGHPKKAITIWDPTHFQKEGRRITSLEVVNKSCFSAEITRGAWRLSLRCDEFDNHTFGVIESSKLEQCKKVVLRNVSTSSVFELDTGNVHHNGNRIAYGNQRPAANSVVILELDMNRHTLVLFVDNRRQPHSIDNIPQKVRFALSIYRKDRYVDVLNFDEVSAQK
ncbi:hypothetical protein BLNAU_1358 [Blattamonas nauphoetae]|uniref:Uncharacterized protein n=1 Tax=Blattamonas nauphoetae TaxID=2049346 RepID=A0ABQ9YJ50_9EUKA|nr:hypothetical protein BLNAU_1358 [Blattamonas nauphoetae]